MQEYPTKKFEKSDLFPSKTQNFNLMKFFQNLNSKIVLFRKFRISDIPYFVDCSEFKFFRICNFQNFGDHSKLHIYFL